MVLEGGRALRRVLRRGSKKLLLEAQILIPMWGPNSQISKLVIQISVGSHCHCSGGLFPQYSGVSPKLFTNPVKSLDTDFLEELIQVTDTEIALQGIN